MNTVVGDEKSSISHQAYMHDEVCKFEKLHTVIFDASSSASKAVASEIASLIRTKAGQGEMCVLGLATGSTPTTVYTELVRMHREEGLSFKNVVTFNLDEYYPMQPDMLQSYVRFMNEYLFNHIDIDRKNIHIPDGTISFDRVESFCRGYEEKITALGGLDLQILGIGRTGHIGFNEPGSGINSRTRIITLDHLTKVDAASDFFGEENVPRRAVTMGVGTIMKAKRILLMAWGEGKSKIISQTIEGPVTDLVPATFLQQHPNATLVLDNASSAELVRIKTPWLVGTCEWNNALTRKAVTWLCQKLKKPVLKLTDRDYNDNGMSDLVSSEHGPAYNINIRVFNELQHTITGWPGGKPNADDTHRPERATPEKKRVIIFSPHPDDDVISMGGTFIKLVDQKHEVHVAYQTSGNIAVFDEDVVRFADFYSDLSKLDKSDSTGKSLYHQVLSAIKNKKPGAVDAPEVQKIKGLIRRGEAKAGCRYVGISDEHAHFLDMPFYETGLVKKKPLSDQDIQIIVDLLKEIKPHQVFAAGDLSDPHGTHRVCLTAIFQALDRLKGEPWINDCWVWLYRGAWQEWDINEIDMAVPLSPGELMKKRKAIFKHQSQKDTAVFPGTDSREFWERAEDRNRATAHVYDALGLAEYEAIEAFKRYHFL